MPPPPSPSPPARAQCPPEVIAAALAADPADPDCVFTIGRCLAASSLWPRPTDLYEYVFQLANDDGSLRAVTLAEWEQRRCPNEVCSTDGACYPHVAPSLSRAGWAGVVYADGRITALASAPVWHPAIQSSGVAEWTAICGITQLLQ